MSEYRPECRKFKTEVNILITQMVQDIKTAIKKKERQNSGKAKIVIFFYMLFFLILLLFFCYKKRSLRMVNLTL